jgi:hypothetical protein
MAISDSNTIAAPTEEVAETTTVETKETTVVTEDKSNKEEEGEAPGKEEVAATTSTPKESHNVEPTLFMMATKEDEVTTEEPADKGPKEEDSIIKDAANEAELGMMVVEGKEPTKKEDAVVLVETKDVEMEAISPTVADEAATITDDTKKVSVAAVSADYFVTTATEDATVIAADQPTVTTMTIIEGEEQTKASIEQIDHPSVATTKKRPSPTKESGADDGEAPANKQKQE